MHHFRDLGYAPAIEISRVAQPVLKVALCWPPSPSVMFVGRHGTAGGTGRHPSASRLTIFRLLIVD